MGCFRLFKSRTVFPFHGFGAKDCRDGEDRDQTGERAFDECYAEGGGQMHNRPFTGFSLKRVEEDG
jgi:hypothetical protein